jgi:hypothetical protein
VDQILDSDATGFSVTVMAVVDTLTIGRPACVVVLGLYAAATGAGPRRHLGNR